VVSLKTAENWMRSEGRTVKAGSQALKWSKIRAGTVSKQRELEVLKERTEGDGESALVNENNSAAAMQGLYARNQTELFVPSPVVNGKVPKNNFGNVDLYVPSMLPAGGAHIPFKGTAKIARKLGFDYAEAVTGFEFKKRRAFPIIEGIVIAAEHESVILEAYWEAEREAEEKAKTKKFDQAVKRWTRLMHGLLIRERLQKQYASNGQSSECNQNGVTDSQPLEGDAHPEKSSGGFLVGADDVVQRYQLPKDFQVSYPPAKPESVEADTLDYGSAHHEEQPLYDPQIMDVDGDMDDDNPQDHPVVPLPQTAASNFVPRTLEEMAEATQPEQTSHSLDVTQEIISLPGNSLSDPPISIQPTPSRTPRRRQLQGSTVVNGAYKRATVPVRKQPPRARARPQNRRRADSPLTDSEESQSEPELMPSGADDGEDDQDASIPFSLPGKRKSSQRMKSRKLAVSAQVAPSDRVLRSRASRTTVPS
jgi:xeroderma pigmentosum group C-complementing protein